MNTPLTRASILERYVRIADRFGAVAAGVADWDAPTPVKEWRARDVVDHLVTWFPAMLTGGTSIRLAPGRKVRRNPVGAWEDLDREVRVLLSDKDLAATSHTNPNTGTRRVEQVVDQYFTTDVFMHTWDLARSSGQDDRLEPDFLAALDAGMRRSAETIRSSGHYGREQPVPADADLQDRFIAFIGRDPRWHPAD
ncbi:maleylpyruvate isomerase family mycothiol-dependent enzyme [Tessaracoccus terricola]